MSFFKNTFGKKTNEDKVPSPRIRLSPDNVKMFPKIEALLKDGKIKFDSNGRLRYLHGAPLGDMILVKIDKDGTPVYKQAAEGYFDPDSQMAKDFVWP